MIREIEIEAVNKNDLIKLIFVTKNVVKKNNYSNPTTK